MASDNTQQGAQNKRVNCAEKVAGWRRMKAWIASRRRVRNGSTTWSWMASNPGGTRSGVFVDHYPVLAIRKLAVEATDNGLLAPELAAGIARVKKASGCARETGCRSNRRRQLPNAPDITTTKALSDRAIIAVLLNGLLAPELAAGIARVKSAKSIGVKSGHWLTLRQPQAPPERAEHHDQQGAARPRHHRRATRLCAAPI